jgi:hypothetical protein
MKIEAPDDRSISGAHHFPLGTEIAFRLRGRATPTVSAIPLDGGWGSISPAFQSLPQTAHDIEMNQ